MATKTVEVGANISIGETSRDGTGVDIVGDIEEIDLRHEVVLGDRQICRIPLDKLIILTQVRLGENPVADKLKESIEVKGLLNQIDVAKLNHESLAYYIEFINEIWSSNHNINDYSPDNEGWHYLVIAGHSRVSSIRMTAQEHPENRYTVCSKIYETPSPQEIVSLQLAENIHHKPTQERQAMAIVEMYHFGLRHKMWDSKAEFLRQNAGDFSRYALDSALHFAELPIDYREFVSIGAFPYTAAVELGRALPIARSYFEDMCLDGNKDQHLSSDIFEEIENTSRIWLGKTVAHIQNMQLNGPAAKKHIQGIANHFLELLEASRNGAQTLDLVMANPDEHLRTYRKETEREYGIILRELSQKPLTAAMRALQLHARVHPNGESIVAEIEDRVKTTFTRIGGTGLFGISRQDSLLA
jgi:hypothetical protein